MDFDRLKESAEIVGAVGAITAVLLAVWKRVIRPLWMRIYAVWNLPAQYAAISEKTEENNTLLRTILKEFRPNGGSSLKDSVDRVNQRQGMVIGMIRGHWEHDHVARFEAQNNGDFCWVNRTFCRWLNMSSDELLFSGWLSAIDESMREEVERHWHSAITAGREFSMNFRMTTTDGVSLPVRCVAAPVKGFTNEIEGWIGTIKPYSEAP